MDARARRNVKRRADIVDLHAHARARIVRARADARARIVKLHADARAHIVDTHAAIIKTEMGKSKFATLLARERRFRIYENNKNETRTPRIGTLLERKHQFRKESFE